jgi:hypothetical protein
MNLNWDLAKNVAAILGLILAAIQLWRVFRPAERLHCQATCVPYRRDPVVHEFYEGNLNRHETATDFFNERVKVGTYWADNARGQDRELNAYWAINIVNAGSKTLKNVRLNIPTVKAVVVEPEKYKTDLAADYTVSVAELSPGHSISISAWSTTYAAGSVITLVHDSGRGQVRVYRPAHPALAWLSSPLAAMLTGFCLLLFFVVVVLLLRR